MRLRRYAPIVGSALALGCVAAAPVASAQAPRATALERVSSVVQPGIVYLETTYKGIVGGRMVTAGGTCTGFFVDPDGHFVTAAHCVDRRDGRELVIEKWLREELDGAEPPPELLDRALDNVRVRSAETPAKAGPDREVAAAYGVDYGGLPTGRPLPVRVLGLRAFQSGDVAVGKIEAENVPVLELAPDESLEVGTRVVSVGYPGSVKLVTDQTFSPSFKDGSISSEKTTGDGLVTVYEVSAAVSRGMSGGPTVDLQGRVVGVNSFGILGESQPFNFISPVAEIEQLMADEGVENTLGPITTTYRQGLDAYYAGDRDEAIARFDDVLGQVQENQFAQEFRAKALRLPEEEDEGGGFPAWLAVLLIVLAVAVAVAAVVLLRRRRDAPASDGRPGGRGGKPAGSALVAKSGPLDGSRFPVAKELVLGRAGADVEIDDPEVSRRHASVEAVDGGMVLTDLGSANGTTVNGRPIEGPTVVVDGDTITLGGASFAVDLPVARAAGRTRLAARPGAGPAAVLVVEDGPLAGERFEVPRELLVGRAGADITVQDPEVSRRHARVRPVDGGVEVTDLGSANGTAVNGTGIDGPTRVKPGDVVTFGNTSMALVSGGTPAQTVSKPSGDGKT